MYFIATAYRIGKEEAVQYAVSPTLDRKEILTRTTPTRSHLGHLYQIYAVSAIVPMIYGFV
jgi:hypothetical protein